MLTLGQIAHFETFGFVILRQVFNAEEVAIISQSLAGRVYADQEPLGEVFRTGGRNFTVVGVVGDVAYEADGTGFG